MSSDRFVDGGITAIENPSVTHIPYRTRPTHSDIRTFGCNIYLFHCRTWRRKLMMDEKFTKNVELACYNFTKSHCIALDAFRKQTSKNELVSERVSRL